MGHGDILYDGVYKLKGAGGQGLRCSGVVDRDDVRRERGSGCR